jgi:hypothetical protein
MSNALRPTACDGRFYPDDPDELKSTVRAYLAGDARIDGTPRAIIAPHAGYVYSGGVAGEAYREVQNPDPPIERVVLAGPSHFVGFDGVAAPSHSAFEMPYGEVSLDRDAVESLQQKGCLHVDDEPHQREHALETHLPFLHETVGDVSIVPLVTGDSDPENLARCFDAWDDPGTLIAVSSDLSHYLDYETACEMDDETRQAIEDLNGDALERGSACGRTAIRALLKLAEHRNYDVHTLEMKNSGDTAGGRNRVVGYGAWVFTD